MGESLDQIAQAIDLDAAFLLIDAVFVGRGADRDVVGLDTGVGENFLYRDAHGRTPAPNRDNKGRLEAAIDDLGTQSKRIVQ